MTKPNYYVTGHTFDGDEVCTPYIQLMFAEGEATRINRDGGSARVIPADDE